MNDIVGISLRKEPLPEIPQTKYPDKHCHFIGQARAGDIFYARAQDIDCPLARYYLGLEKVDLKDLCRTLVNWNDALNEGVALNYLKSAICLEKGPKYIIYFPYPHKNLKPDVIIKISNPQQIMGIVQKFSSVTGERLKATLSGIGAACGECTAYPLVTGKANISMGCYGSRPGVNLKREELFLAAPFASKLAEILLEEIEG